MCCLLSETVFWSLWLCCYDNLHPPLLPLILSQIVWEKQHPWVNWWETTNTHTHTHTHTHWLSQSLPPLSHSPSLTTDDVTLHQPSRHQSRQSTRMSAYLTVLTMAAAVPTDSIRLSQWLAKLNPARSRHWDYIIAHIRRPYHQCSCTCHIPQSAATPRYVGLQ